MKRSSWAIATLFLVMAAPASAAVTGNVNIFLGEKTLDSNDWVPPFDEQGEFGILFDIRGDYWPVSLAVDLLGSSHQVDYADGYTEVSTSELDLGVRKIFDIYGTSLHPYVGGGLGLITGRVEDAYYYYDPICGYACISEDTGLGIWLNGGVYWSIMDHFNIGLDVRYSEADITLYDSFSGTNRTVNAGGTHGGLVFGYRW